MSAREDFLSHGWCSARGVLDSQSVGDARENVARYVSDVVPEIDSSFTYFEDRERPETLKQMQMMHEHDGWFAALAAKGPIPLLAELLLGEPVVLKNVQYFSKPPRESRPTPPHQDGRYFMIEPMRAVALWLALDPVDKSNGCVRYVSGSHWLPLRSHARTDVLGFSQGITDFGAEDREREYACTAAPGDVLAHHAGTIHRADANMSDSFRRAIGFVYYGTSAQEDTERHAAYQRSLHDDLSRRGRI